MVANLFFTLIFTWMAYHVVRLTVGFLFGAWPLDDDDDPPLDGGYA